MGKREQPAFRCALHVLKDINLEVAEGEKLVIIGPSGSGKSTTVLKNLTLAPMKLHHKTKQEAEELAYHYLEVVGLRDKANVYPAQLSGGQQQRIAIARALCAQTKIILFDKTSVCASSWARSSGKQFWSLRSCRSTSGTRCG